LSWSFNRAVTAALGVGVTGRGFEKAVSGGAVDTGGEFGLVVAGISGGVGDEDGRFESAISDGAGLDIRCFDTVHLLVLQEIVKTTQIGRFDGHLRRRGQLSAVARQGDHGLGRERRCLSQEAAQRVVHGRLAVVGRMLQNSQVRTPRHVGNMFVAQPIVGHAKTAGGKQVLAITVVVEGARLAHQLVDDVPVMDRMFVASDQARQRVHFRSRVPDFHTVGMQSGFDLFADQPAMHRIGIAVDVDQAAAVHAHRQAQATVQALRRQVSQYGEFRGVPRLSRRIARGHHFLKKAAIRVAAAEVAGAAQQQRLVHRGLEMPVRRLAVTVLVRLPNIDPLAGQTIMLQQAAIARLKLTLGRQVVDGSTQAVAAMAPRHASQFPQRVLQAVGQRLERLRHAQRHGLPVGVREHEVIEHVLEALTQDSHSQRVHAGEVRGRQVAGVMHLAEHDRARLARRGPPVPDTPLKGAALAPRQPPGMLLDEPVEQRLGVQPRLRFEPCLNLGP